MRTIYFEKNIPKILLTKALRPLWPSVVYSPLSPTQMRDVPDAPLPGPNWVRVRNRLGGICASDLHLLFVETDPMIGIAALPGLARVYLGHETLGDVVEVGAGVDTFAVGDRVLMDSRALLIPTCVSQGLDPICRHCAQGNYALCENASAETGTFGVGGGWGDGYTAHMSEVFKVPEELDDESAMMIEPLAVGVRAVLRHLPVSGDRVLVLGAGIVGLNVLQALRALSPECDITVIARYPHQMEMAQRLGATRVVNDNIYTTAAAATDGRLYTGPFNNRMMLGGFDVIFDCVGSARSLQDCLRVARAGGTVVLVGVNLARLRVDLSPVWYQEVNLIGTMAHGIETWQNRPIPTYDLVCKLLVERRLTIEGLITHSFRLDQWREAIKTATDKHTGAIKVILDYRSQPTDMNGATE